jgi:iron complex transport system ATP-binding protein
LFSADASQEVSSALIRVEQLRCGYPGHDVLKGVSFEIQRGEFVGILGPNGSGKTTLLLALSGVAPLQQGDVGIQGTPLERLKPKDRARRMAAVAQESQVRFPYSCEEVVRMGRYPHQKHWQMDSLEDEEVVRRCLEIMDIQELAERMISATSGGERQRVVLARALAQEAPILLLDEATSAMDVHRKLQVFRVLERLNREEGLTVLAVLHDVNLAALFCQRMIFLKEGEIVADGPTEEVLNAEILEKVYQTRVWVQDVPMTGKQQVVFLP